MKFSQRIGVISAEKLTQIESIDDDLRNSMWNALSTFYWNTFDREKYYIGSRCDNIRGSNLGSLFESIWLHYFKKPTDTIPDLYYDSRGGYEVLRQYYFKAEWYEVYDFVEFVATHGAECSKAEFICSCNRFMQRENSAYSFVHENIVEISSQEEIDEVEQALENAQPYYGAKKHLEQALVLLKNKINPDFRNSIKESISAVESLCREVSGDNKATLGNALKALEATAALHPALRRAFSALYGYTSDSGGIRHALLEESSLSKSDARFMLISCSAFINYVISNIEVDL